MDDEHAPFSQRAQRLNDARRLETQVSEKALARLLALRGDEDVVDLGSGTGFYTDRIAGLTSGTVFAVELEPEMNDLYLERGLPPNVRLVPGDITDLPLAPASVDVACSIVTLHETGGSMGLPKLLDVLRPGGRLVVIDWRRNPESLESGPPADLRFTKEEAAQKLAPFFSAVHAEDLGRFMFAVVATMDSPVAE
ncbi:MAG: class I SAM-dependent methyltransferase [bacterium]